MLMTLYMNAPVIGLAEEICTLVIAEAFPEDGGLFCCTATNQYGSDNSMAQLTVTPGVFTLYLQ